MSLTYDGYGRRSITTDGAGTQTYAYDDSDRPLSVSTTYTGLATKSITYSYWPDGSRQTMGTPAGAFSYQYDAAGRMTGLTNPYGETSSWQYLDNGWLWKQALGNGATATYTYNALGQTTDLLNRDGGNALLSDFASPTQGGFDGAGNRTALTATLPNVPYGYDGDTAYAYDTKDQLTQEQSTRAGGYTNAFGYDGAGNATTFRGQGRSFNADNQEMFVTNWDGNGNRSRNQGHLFGYDPENRLSLVRNGNGPAYVQQAMAYTGDGLRASRSAYGGAPTYFLYDGDAPVCELDSSGNVSAVTTSGANGLLSRRTGVGSAFYTFDMQGNVAQRLDGSGGVASSDVYDAFGLGASTASAADVFGFGGQWGYYTDSETGLALCTHRYYDPQAGRWLTRDPIGYGGGVNLYGYVTNNPVNASDPKGLTEKVTTDSSDEDIDAEIKKLNIELNSGGKTLKQRQEIEREINELKREKNKNQKGRGTRNVNKRKGYRHSFSPCPPQRVKIGKPIITDDPVVIVPVGPGPTWMPGPLSDDPAENTPIRVRGRVPIRFRFPIRIWLPVP